MGLCHLTDATRGFAALAITAYATESQMKRAFEEGVLAILAKPIEITPLLTKLASITQGSVVLVVEDDVELCQNLAEILADNGFSAREAHTCAEARRIAATTELCCVVVDRRLPDGDGVELLTELAGREGCHGMLITGEKAQDVPALRDALDDTLEVAEKPLDMRALLRWLQTASRAGAARRD